VCATARHGRRRGVDDMLIATEPSITRPLQPGWLPESQLAWVEELRVEHERRVELRDRFMAAYDGLEGHWAAVQVDYRAAVRAALAAGEQIPALPDVLQPEQQRIVLEESAAALADAKNAVQMFVREAIVGLIERQGELEAAGDALRQLWELVSEPARVGAERAELMQARDDARAAGEALLAGFAAQDHEDRLATARLARGDWLPSDFQAGEVVHEVRHGDIAGRREAQRGASEAYREADEALSDFDRVHRWSEYPFARYAPQAQSTWLGGA
jgi:hypothetical protein